MWLRRAILLFILTFSALALGCSSIPEGMSAVDVVSVEGNDALSAGDIQGKIATTASPKFIGLFQGFVYDYELFDRGVLQRDLERVERLYKARGYYEAKARAGRVIHTEDNHVEVTIVVEEGAPVVVKDVRVLGLEGLEEGDAADVKAASEIVTLGEPFAEESFNKAQADMTKALTDRGYAFAKVQQSAQVDLPNHVAHVVYQVTRGPKAKFGAITIEGLKDLPEDGVRTAIDIDPGEEYSTLTIERARDAVIALGTFSSVSFEPVLTDPPPADASVPIVVKLHESKYKSVILGGGFQFDAIRTEFHLQAGWEHKNLFGGFRHFRVDVKPGVVLYPTSLTNFETPTDFLPEEKFRVSLRQPGFIEARTTGVIASEVNTYPILLAPVVDPDAPVLGYFEYKGSVGLERSFWKFFASPTYNFQYNLPFAYTGLLDPNLTGIIISYLGAFGHFDFRDDKIRPHKGLYIENDFQFAGLGGDARDFRLKPEIRGYIPLGDKVTLASRFTVGFLFPMNYGGAAQLHARGQGEADSADVTRDLSIIYLRGFFSGGPSSNRGYPYRGVGPHGSVPFFNPGVAAAQLARECEPNGENFDEAKCAVPLGGMTLWEATIEVRYPIIEPLGGTVFCDASDVSIEQFNLRFNYPHLSCGVGLRYDTPIGPIRVDVGYRIPGAQFPSGADPRREGTPSTIFGAPIAIAFGLGEAF